MRIIKNKSFRILQQNQENHRISCENNANHATPIIQLANYENLRNLEDNNENHENLRIPLDN